MLLTMRPHGATMKISDLLWRSHSACATARFATALRAACETEAADRIRRHRRATGGSRIYTFVAGGCGERTTRAARAGGPEIKSAGESRSIAWRKEYVRALFGDGLTAGLTAIRRAGIASTAPRTQPGSRP